MTMRFVLPLLCLVPFLLSSCSAIGVATGVGASAGVAAAQEGGFKRALQDAKIQAQINDLWFKYDLEAFAKLDMTINQGRVLLTGVVQNPEHRVEAVRLSWQPEGVSQVINEIRVAESAGIIGYARDSWISARLRTAITFDRDVQSVNYNIDTVQGTVYLMGVAQDQAELNRVIETARTISDVRQVVSYVKVAGPAMPESGSELDERADESQPQSQSGNQEDHQGQYTDHIEADSAPIPLSPINAEPL